MKLDKEYEAALKLGWTSTTGDPEGTVKKRPAGYRIPSEARIRDVLEGFVGDIEQVPPAFSAVKVDGRRSYELARAGRPAALKSRSVKIRSLRLLYYDWPTLRIGVVCSSGTYIRTLGEDIGESLGTGAYLTELRRIGIGEYDVKDALSVNEVDTADLI